MSLPNLSGTGRLVGAEAASRPVFWSHVDFMGDCWEWRGATTQWGYGKLRYAGHDFTAHRCSFEFAHGALGRDEWVLHSCDNPPCVKPSHLFRGDAKLNTQDMIAKGRAARLGAQGRANAHSVVTEGQVVEMRARFAAGDATPIELADQFGITNSAVNQILRGRTWSHVGGPICTRDRRGEHSRRKAS